MTDPAAAPAGPFDVFAICRPFDIFPGLLKPPEPDPEPDPPA
jgi:hypothetical protein